MSLSIAQSTAWLLLTAVFLPNRAPAQTEVVVRVRAGSAADANQVRWQRCLSVRERRMQELLSPSASASELESATTPSSDSIFELSVEPGLWSFEVNVGDGSLAWHCALVGWGRPWSIDLVLEQTGRSDVGPFWAADRPSDSSAAKMLEVSVVDEVGDPADGVIFFDPGTGRAIGVSDENGRATVAIGSDQVELGVSGPRGQISKVDVRLEVKASTPIRLPPPRIVSGTVWARSSGDPLARALVWPVDDPGRFVVTDAMGGFEIPVPATSSPSVLRVAAEGFGAEQLTDEDLEAWGGTVLLSRPRTVEGVVQHGSGAPIRGAEVEVRPAGYAGLLPEAAPMERGSPNSSITGRSGRFFVELPGPEVYSLKVTAPGSGEEEVALPVLEPGDVHRVTVTLADRLTVRGWVVDVDDLPVAGAEVSFERIEASGDPFRVSLLRRLGPKLPAASSDLDGVFEASLVEGRYTVRVAAAGFAPLHLSGVEVGGSRGQAEPVDLGTLVLSSGGAVFARVTDQEGLPIGGATVSAELSQAGQELDRRELRLPMAEAVSDESGEVMLIGPESGTQINLLAEAEGYLPLFRSRVEVGPEPLELVLERAHALSGEVRGEDGAVLAGAELQLHRQTGSAIQLLSRLTATTDSTGRFEVKKLDAGAWQVEVSAAGHVGERRSVEIPAPDQLFELSEAVRVRGVVRDEDGEPIEGVAVERVREVPQGVRGASPFRVVANSDTAGSFVLDDLAPGSTLELRFSCVGFRSATLALEIGDESEVVEVTLEAGVAVSGWVRETSGAPAPAASVLALRGTRQLAVTATSVTGAFELSGLEAGPLVLRAEMEGRAAAQTETPLELTDAGLSDIELVFAEAGAIEGRVIGLPFEKTSQAQINASRVGSPRDFKIVPVSYQGEFWLENLAVGTWMLMLTGAGPVVREEVDVKSGERTFVELELESGIVVEGTVTRSGAPLADAQLMWAGSGGLAAMARTDGAGAYTVSGLEEGEYRVQIGHHQSLLHSETVELRESTEVDFALEAVPLTVAIYAADDRAPVGGAEVKGVVVGVGDGGGRARGISSASGAVTLSFGAPGEVRLTVTTEGYAPYSDVVQLDEGGTEVEVPLARSSGLRVRLSASELLPGSVLVALGDPAGKLFSWETRIPTAEGVLDLEDVPRAPFSIHVTADGWATGSRAVGSGPAGGEIEVRLQPGGGLRGTVDPGSETAGARSVRLRGPGGELYRSLGRGRLVDSWPVFAGRFSISGLPEGRWTLEVGEGETSTSLEVIVSARGVTQVLVP